MRREQSHGPGCDSFLPKPLTLNPGPGSGYSRMRSEAVSKSGSAWDHEGPGCRLSPASIPECSLVADTFPVTLNDRGTDVSKPDSNDPVKGTENRPVAPKSFNARTGDPNMDDWRTKNWSNETIRPCGTKRKNPLPLSVELAMPLEWTHDGRPSLLVCRALGTREKVSIVLDRMDVPRYQTPSFPPHSHFSERRPWFRSDRSCTVHGCYAREPVLDLRGRECRPGCPSLPRATCFGRRLTDW